MPWELWATEQSTLKSKGSPPLIIRAPIKLLQGHHRFNRYGAYLDYVLDNKGVNFNLEKSHDYPGRQFIIFPPLILTPQNTIAVREGQLSTLQKTWVRAINFGTFNYPQSGSSVVRFIDAEQNLVTEIAWRHVENHVVQ